MDKCIWFEGLARLRIKMVKYPPYVNAYGQLKELFTKIKEAQSPPKFSQDFLSSVLGLKSSSYRPMIPFLKRLGFLDQANVPTKSYTEYRDESKSKIIMAEQVTKAYQVLFTAHTYAYTLKREEIISKLSSTLGTSRDDKMLPLVAATFSELCKLADFEARMPTERQGKIVEATTQETGLAPLPNATRLGISYTINLNLPPTTDPKVFDAIFKSLKEYLLK